MDKTKYIKVAVSDRLPDRSGVFSTNIGWLYFNPDSKEWGYHYPSPIPEYWVKEVPDHEEEMRELLEQFISDYEKGEDACSTMLSAKILLTKIK